MATWTVEIMVTDLKSKAFDAIGTRTDGEDVRTYRLSTRWDASLNRLQNGAKIRDALRSMYDADVARELSLSAFIGSLESDLAAALDAQEV